MKKRFVLLVLAVLLVLGLVTVAAADSSNSETTNDEAYLAFWYAEWDKATNGWYIPTEPVDIQNATLPLGSNLIGQFVFVNGNSATPVALDKLTCSGVAVVEVQESNENQVENLVRLSVSQCGEGKVSYTKDGATYSFPVTGTLPDVGFYSTAEATETGYLSAFDLTANSNTFYLVAKGGGILTDVNLDTASQGMATVTAVEDNTSAWKVQITGEPTDNWLELTYTVAYNTTNSRTRNFGIQINDLRPGLFFRQAEHRGTGGWTMSETAQRFKTTTLSLDSSHIGQFVYYDGQTTTPVALQSLTWDGSASVESFDYDGAEKIEHAVILSVNKCGAGKVSYTKDGTTYSFSVTGTLPDVAFYSSSTASESAYLTSFDVTETAKTFYLVAGEGWTINSVSLSDEFAAIAKIEEVADTKGVYQITVTGQPADRWYELTPSATNTNGRKHEYPVSIQLCDGTPALRYYYVNSRDGQLVQDTEQRALSQQPFLKGSSLRLCLYYGTKTSSQVVDSITVDKPEILTVTQKKLSNGTTYYEFECKDFGEAKLTFKVGNQTYTRTVNVTMSDPWFFTAQSRDEEHYCANGIAVNELENNVVWVMKEGGFTENELSSLKVTLDEQLFTNCEKAQRTDGNYDLKLTLPNVEPDEWCQLNVRVNGSGIGTSVYFNMDGQAAYVEDYVIGWSWTDEDSGIVRINEGNWQMGAGSIDVDDSYSEFRTLQIAAGIKKTDAQSNVYYELADSEKVSLTVKKLWLEVLYGEKDCFSLSETEFVQEQTNGFGTDVTLYSKAGNRGGIRLWAEVEIKVGDQTTTEKVSITCISSRTGYYTESRKQGDTVDALNAYLEQLVENGLEKNATYEVVLANQEYTGTIKIPEEFEAGNGGTDLVLRGSTSKDGTAATIIRGAIDLNGATVSDLRELHFKATDTCKKAISGGSLLNMSCCSFEGYDIAADATVGCVTLTDGNVFVNNKVAVCVDLADSRLGVNQSSWKNNTFIGNGTAVQIKSLHSFISAYYLRILDSNFIGNKLDFDMQCEGTLYMYRNYFCQAKELTDSLLQDLYAARTEALVNSYLTYSKPTIQCIDGSRVLTNPRWLLPVLDWWRCGTPIEKVFPASGAAAAAVALEDDYENKLVSDWELDTWILNEDADDLILDSSAFDETGEKEIEVLDKEENSLGTWSFDGED